MGYTLAYGSTVAQLAYADDLCVLVSEQHEVQRALDVFKEFSSWCGLKLNVDNGGCLSCINNNRRGHYVKAFSPMYDSVYIPALRWEDTYSYL